MKKVLLITNSYPIHPRLKKISKLYPNDEVKFLAWDRNNLSSDNDNFILKSKIGYSNKLKKVFAILDFFNFIKKTIKEYNPDIIVTRYWEPMFLASLAINKNTEFHYDVCDMPSKKTFTLLEKIGLKKVDKIYLASRFFKEFYNKEKVILFENKPESNTVRFDETFEYETDKLKLCFIGGIRYFDIFKNLVDAIKDLEVELFCFGGGPDETKLKEYCLSNKISNIHFYGSYDYTEVHKFYNFADVIWSAYDSRIFNVKYAISNKFFESIAFNKLGIYAENTELGQYVKENKIGFTVNELEKDAIRHLIMTMIGSNAETSHYLQNLGNLKDKLLNE